MQLPALRSSINALFRPSSQRVTPSLLTLTRRTLATNVDRPADAPEATDEEQDVLRKLSSNFKNGSIAVQDMSGGCGSFYAIQIVDEAFEGLNKVKQHQKVNGILAEEVARWHGVQLQTRAP